MIAPTGTIGLVMDCDTTGIEPDFALVKFKKLAGGGYFKIINRTVPLKPLPGSATPKSEIEQHRPLRGWHGTLRGCAGHQSSRRSVPSGFTDAAVEIG